jgi:hypothetical protein
MQGLNQPAEFFQRAGDRRRTTLHPQFSVDIFQVLADGADVNAHFERDPMYSSALKLP